MKLAALFDVTGVITGGAGGIGYAYVEAMTDDGARFTPLDIDRTGLPVGFENLRARAATSTA
jgi:NAD(P)-dependent dehydrogenase (short-subunit alcohol dehydrogenase family)